MKRLELLEIQVTNKCNMNCKYCFNGEETTYQLINISLLKRRILNVIKKIESNERIMQIRITGGEPLTEPETVSEIVSFCKQNNIMTELSTNGILLPRYIQALTEQGLNSVKISYDSFDEAIFDNHRGNVQDLVMEGLVTAIKSQLKTTVRVTISRFNDSEVKDTINRLLGLGVDVVEVKSIIPVGRAETNMMPDHKSLQNLFRDICHRWDSKRVKIYCSYFPFCEGFYYPNNVPCTCCSTTVYISADGYIEPCSYFPRQRRFNIMRDDILDAWNSRWFASIRNGENSECLHCKDWEKCKNGCPAILYAFDRKEGSCYKLIEELR